MDCSICFEAIEDATGHVKMGCAHLFHFRCIAHWFTQQASNEQSQNCPCCRRVGSDLETFPDLPADAEEDEEEDDGESWELEEEPENIWITRAELHEILISLGGTGVPDALWFYFFEPEGNEDIRMDATRHLPFVCHEIEGFAIAQGGRLFTEEEWEVLVDRYPELEEDEDEEAEEPEEPAAEPLVVQVFRGWRRVNAGRWERTLLLPPSGVLNPEEHIWDGLLDQAAEPPDSLVLQMSDAATKMKALWKGSRDRERFSVARALLTLR